MRQSATRRLLMVITGTGSIRLRVLRPASGGGYTGAGSSPTETLMGPGVSTFAISLLVRAGDVLALDNSTSVLIFDTSSSAPLTAYYQPSINDGQTLPPPSNVQSGYRLLLSATVQASATGTGGTGGTGGAGGGAVGSPHVTHFTQSHRVWRAGSRLPSAARRRAPVGTSFAFALDRAAQVTFVFSQRASGRRVKGRCVRANRSNRRGRSCPLTVTRGRLSFHAHAGTNRLVFQGRLNSRQKLAPGRYAVTITATGANQRRSAPRSLSFTIVR